MRACLKKSAAVVVFAVLAAAAAPASAASPGEPPVNASAPTLGGEVLIGGVLACAGGAWNGAPPITLSYQWLRDGAPIPNAIATTYEVADADVGHTLACAVTATNPAGSSSATSQPTAAVPAPPVMVVNAPTVPTIGEAAVVTHSAVRAVKGLRLGQITRRGGFTAHVRIAAATRAKVELVLRSRSAHAASTRVLATGTIRAGAGGTVHLRIRLTADGRRALRATRRVVVTLRSVVTRAGKSASHTHVVALRP